MSADENRWARLALRERSVAPGRARLGVGALLALSLAACACGEPAEGGFGTRTFDQPVVAITDLGDSFGVILEDRTVAIAPNDPSAPLERLGSVGGEAGVDITEAGPLLLATSRAGSEGFQVQAFSRADCSVRGLAQGYVSTCSRGDAPVVYVLRDDGAWWGRQYDPTTLAVSHEGLLGGHAALGGCEGDAWGLVLRETFVRFDAESSEWLATRDTPEGGDRRLRVPGEILGWTLHGGSVFALVGAPGGRPSGPRLHRIDRQGGEPTAIGLPMAAAYSLVVGDRYACVADDAIRPPHHVWRVALDGSATEVVHEGDRLDCVGVRGDRVIVLRGRSLVALPE